MATALTEFYPFAAGPGAVVTEAQWRTLMGPLLATGVLAGEGNELAVVQDTPASMQVTVRSGQARIHGHVGVQTADVDLAVTANASGNPRIDLVVARCDYDGNVIEFDVIAGVPGVAPVVPSPTQDATMYELPLAEVAVANGAVSIVTANITDRRVFTYSEQDPPLPAMTTTERDALTHVRNGLAIYNSTVGKIQVRLAGAWVNVRTEGSTTIRVAWTYTLPGDISVPSGSENYLPPAFIEVPSGQTVTLVGYRWMLGYGTSFTFSLNHRAWTTGTVTALVSGVVATSTGTQVGTGSFTPKVCADGDQWAPQIAAVSGSPKGGAVAVIADVTV